MAKQFLTGLNLNKNELLNARIQNLSTAPSSPVVGQIYYDTDTNQITLWNGTAWISLAGGGDTATMITNAIDALTTTVIEEGTNLYFTEERAMDAIATAIAAGTHSNITITYDDATNKFTFAAENGVADSTTDNLTEGTTNKYFTDERAQDAIGNSVGTGLTYNDTTGAISVTANTYDAYGSASTVAGNLTTHTGATEAHGATGAVVGTTNTQTLTNKTLTSPKINEDVALSATATELNVLDGITSSTAELNILDGATVSAAELNILDGATLSTTELNYVDGVTSAIQTQLDAKLALAGGTMTGAIAMGTSKITGLGTPTEGTDAATKAYVDSAAQGIDWKASVRAATTAAVTLATDLEAGDVIDGVTLVAGDRILVKNQATGSQNGIYVVQATGAPTRSTDADAGAEVTASLAVFVEEGTAQADAGWVLTNNGTVTIGTTALAFTQFTGLGQITAGDGLTKTGNTLNVVGTADRITANGDSIDIASTYAGQSSIVTLGTVTTGVWNGTDIAVADGGTGASTAADARTNLGATTKYTVANPELTVTSGQVTWTVTHNLGIRTVIVQVYDAVSYDQVEVDVVRTGTNTATLTWVASATIDAGKYQVVIVG
jgi:hypothetical protein